MGKGFRKAFRILGLDERKVGGQCNQIFMGIFGSMLHGFLPFSLASWHGLNHAHSGMDGKATPAQDLNHVPCISFAGAQKTFSTISSEFTYLLSVVEFNNSQKLFMT